MRMISRYGQAIWALRRVRDLYDEARALPLDRATQERVNQLGMEIAQCIGSSIAWMEPGAAARAKALADEIERDLRQFVPSLPPARLSQKTPKRDNNRASWWPTSEP